jgi:hypothetical protein
MSVDGTWNITFESPLGSQEGQLILTTSGNTLTGKIKSELGESDISNGTVNGNEISWTIEVTEPVKLSIVNTGTIDGDKLSGTAKLGDLGDATFNGARA